MEVIIGRIYRHFKGDLYRVLNVAIHTETGEKMVVYQAVSDEEKVFVRPYDMFISPVDKEKYPNEKAEFRFTLVNENEDEINPGLEAFMDAESINERIRVLIDLKDQLPGDVLQLMAYSLDIVLRSENVDDRYKELLDCLMRLAKFEGDHLRGK